MSKHLYIISGLGADERIFKDMDFSGFVVKHIQWLRPEKKETIENYSARLLTQIDSESPIILGFSFGGIIAVEIAKQIKTEKIILMGSAKTKNEIPFYFRLAGTLGINKIIPAYMMQHAQLIVNWGFGVTEKSHKELLRQIMLDMDPVFLKWAIDKIFHWKNTFIPENLIHIHGIADRILPVRYTKNDSTINGGGHFMTITHADELSELLRTFLNPNT